MKNEKEPINKGIKVFIAYAKADEDIAIRNRLLKQLAILETNGTIEIWYDDKTLAHQDKNAQIAKELNDANIILLLISPDFLHSYACYDQMTKALVRHEKKETRVIPVIIRACMWELAPFRHIKDIKVLPLNGVHTTSAMWETADEPHVKITKALYTQIAEDNNIEIEDKEQARPKRKQGRVLYRIPDKMQLKKVSTCTIRIAPEEVEEAILKENLKDADEAVIEDLRKIGKLMRVKLLDESNGTAFNIRCKGEEVQLIDEDDYTEWLYDVTPLLAGKHRLELQVAVVTKDEFGKEYKNIVALDRVIEIVTETVTEKSDWRKLRKNSAELILPTKKRKGKKTKKKKKKRGKQKLKMFSIGLLFVLFTPILTWAVAPQLIMPLIWNVIYDDYKYLSDERIAVEEDGKWHIVNKWGITVPSETYEEVEKYENGVSQVKKADKWGGVMQNDVTASWWNRLSEPKDRMVIPMLTDTIFEINQIEQTAKVFMGGKKDTLTIYLLNADSVSMKKAKVTIQRLPKTVQNTLTKIDSLFEKKKVEQGMEALKAFKSRKLDEIEHIELQNAKKNEWLNIYIMQSYEAAAKGNDKEMKELYETIEDLKKDSKGESWDMPEQKKKKKSIGKNYKSKAEDWATDSDGKSTKIDGKNTTIAENTPPKTEENKVNTAEKMSVDEPKLTETVKIEDNKVADNIPPKAEETKQDNVNRAEKINNTATSDTEKMTAKTDIPAVIQKLINDMVRVQGGTFRMGCDEQRDGDCNDDEKLVHDVTLSSYEIGKYEVTQAQWQAVMGDNPSHFKGCDNCPVEEVSWNDIQDFLTKLNSMTGKKFRLPSEAEWEYATRGGNKSNNTKYSGSNNIDEVAWYGLNSGDKTQEVGSKGKSNELGLYDMSGNVYEWCEDFYDADYYQKSTQTNPVNNNDGIRVLRGGSWYDDHAKRCRVANRYNYYPSSRNSYNGFRLAHS